MTDYPEGFEPYDPDDGRTRPFAPAGDEGGSRRGLASQDDTTPCGGAGPEPWHVPQGLSIVSAADFADFPKPRREFVVPGADLFPVRNVSAIYGDGGTGKSLLALQLAVAAASGTSWLGYMPEAVGGVLYISAEDDQDEMHIRLKDIVEGGEANFDNLHSLDLVFLAGQDAILAAEDAKGSRMVKAELFDRLVTTMKNTGASLVILDNLADIFAGNENSKPLARQFIGMLRGLAVRFNATFIILAHPSLSGMSSGTGTAGNTAWSNSVRSRLYLKRQHDDPKEITDPDYRRLVTMKANYGATGGEIGMRWEKGRFVATETPATATAATSGLDRVAAASKAERVFLALVQRFNDEKRNICPTSGSNYAPLVFSKHPQAEGVTKRQFEIAMDTLFASNRIEVVEQGPPSKLRKNIVVKVTEVVE